MYNYIFSLSVYQHSNWVDAMENYSYSHLYIRSLVQKCGLNPQILTSSLFLVSPKPGAYQTVYVSLHGWPTGSIFSVVSICKLGLGVFTETH